MTYTQTRQARFNHFWWIERSRVYIEIRKFGQWPLFPLAAKFLEDVPRAMNRRQFATQKTHVRRPKISSTNIGFVTFRRQTSHLYTKA